MKIIESFLKFQFVLSKLGPNFASHFERSFSNHTTPGMEEVEQRMEQLPSYGYTSSNDHPNCFAKLTLNSVPR